MQYLRISKATFQIKLRNMENFFSVHQKICQKFTSNIKSHRTRNGLHRSPKKWSSNRSGKYIRVTVALKDGCQVQIVEYQFLCSGSQKISTVKTRQSYLSTSVTQVVLLLFHFNLDSKHAQKGATAILFQRQFLNLEIGIFRQHSFGLNS